MTISEDAGTTALTVVEQACRVIGLSARGAEPVRIAENQIWRLPGQVILRIARPGQMASAKREVRVARWLADQGVPAVRPLDVHQPIEVEGRPVTAWEELPSHQDGTATDVAHLLKQLHALPTPEFHVGILDPFVRLPERIASATTLTSDDRAWLHSRLAELKDTWSIRAAGLPHCLVHGDAWTGNVKLTAAGPVWLDLERFSIGTPEWDLTSTAAKLTTAGSVTAHEYAAFCAVYGADVTQSDDYPLFAAARELRMATYAAQHAAAHPEWHAEAQHRVSCLRGRNGPRPWRWIGIV